MAKSGLLGSRTASLLPPESLEEVERVSKQGSERTHSPEHTHTHKRWHLMEERSAAKALYSPQLALSSDTHPNPSSGEPSPRFSFKEALMSFFSSSADMTFGCVTQTFVHLCTKNNNILNIQSQITQICPPIFC